MFTAQNTKVSPNFLVWKFRENAKITAPKMKFSIKDFFSKCDQIRRKMRIWSHLLKKSLMENFIFCAMNSRESLVVLRMFLQNSHCSKLGEVFVYCAVNAIEQADNMTKSLKRFLNRGVDNMVGRKGHISLFFSLFHWIWINLRS